MGINQVLTPEDMLKTEPVEPGWYPARIISYTEQETKAKPGQRPDGSLNAVFEFQILDGPVNVKGRKFKRYFNEKVLFMGKEFWVVIIPGFGKKEGGQLNSDAFRSSVGKELKVYLGKDTNTGYDSILGYKGLEE